MQNATRQELESRIAALSEHLAAIRRQMEKLIAENRRMREIVRLAEKELRKRRNQIAQLEQELQSLQNNRLEVKARVENAIEKLDDLIIEKEERS